MFCVNTAIRTVSGYCDVARLDVFRDEICCVAGTRVLKVHGKNVHFLYPMLLGEEVDLTPGPGASTLLSTSARFGFACELHNVVEPKNRASQHPGKGEPIGYPLPGAPRSPAFYLIEGRDFATLLTKRSYVSLLRGDGNGTVLQFVSEDGAFEFTLTPAGAELIDGLTRFEHDLQGRLAHPRAHEFSATDVNLFTVFRDDEYEDQSTWGGRFGGEYISEIRQIAASEISSSFFSNTPEECRGRGFDALQVTRAALLGRCKPMSGPQGP